MPVHCGGSDRPVRATSIQSVLFQYRLDLKTQGQFCTRRILFALIIVHLMSLAQIYIHGVIWLRSAILPRHVSHWCTLLYQRQHLNSKPFYDNRTKSWFPGQPYEQFQLPRLMIWSLVHCHLREIATLLSHFWWDPGYIKHQLDQSRNARKHGSTLRIFWDEIPSNDPWDIRSRRFYFWNREKKWQNLENSRQDPKPST